MLFRLARCLALAAGLALAAALPAHAGPDTVLDWVQTVETATAKVPGIRAERAHAIAWLAAFNALVAIEPRYRAYAPAPTTLSAGAPRPSAEAAIAAALFTALAVEPEADHALLAARYREALAGVKNGGEREAGIALGSEAATLLLGARAGDRLGRVEPAAVAAGPGVFVATGPRSITPARLAPFGVGSVTAAAFDPGPPPVVGGAQALREVEETGSFGFVGSAVRSADQTAAAIFWNSGGEGDYAAMLRPGLEARKLDALDLARMAALDAMINVDSRIVGALLKEKYLSWRPMSAIAGPFSARRDASWQPLVRTPNDPQYPSGASTGAGIMEVEITRLYGLPGPVEWLNTQTRQTRRWPSAEKMAEEAATARVWAGAHFRSSVEAGRRLGRAVANDVIDRQLLPR